MAAYVDYSVRLNDESIRHSEIDSPVSQNVFKVWKQVEHKRPVCECSSLHPKLSVVNGARYHLRSFPGTTMQHKARCRFFGLPSEMMPRDYLSAKAFNKNMESGEITMQGHMPLVSKPNARFPEGPKFHRKEKGRKKQLRMTALGVLQQLLESAGINTYTSDRGIEHWGHVIERIHDLSKSIKYNKMPLNKRLFFMGSPDKAISRKWIAAANEFKGSQRDNFMVIAPISGMVESKFGYRINIPGQSEQIYCTSEQYESFNRRFKLAAKAQSSHSDICTALILCRWSNNHKYLIAESVVALPLDKYYLPYDSSYEKILNEHLVLMGRCFIKPLRMSDGLHMFPDYILIDQEETTVLEVYGRTDDPEYVAHMREKHEYYKKKGIIEWWWKPLESMVIPELFEVRCQA